ncbi:MAG: hypothetical protein GY935_21940 [Gammaproteobacteria bacterium]|nr:hypothetical protein [Gammaproteobacteria bacterium]
MGRRRKVKNNQRSTSSMSAEKINKRRWRSFRHFFIFSTILVSLAGAGFASFKHNYDIEHDLSVIGKGKPTVVQIHDPKCRLCAQLRRNAGNAIDQIGDEMLFRVADITTPQGRRLQNKHDVPIVTLLLFDARGELRQVLNGVKDDDLLYRTFLAHLDRIARRSQNIAG